jgi:ABC-type multidrug transport system permease subunit
MKNTYFLIKKNLKLLIRSKSSALIVILAPLILILLIGFSYNNFQTGLNIGISSPNFDGEATNFIETLQEEDYKIIKYESPEKCIEDIKLSFVHTCLSLPENFQISDNSPKEITFYIDQSKINLVYLITDSINKRFNIKSREISQKLTSDILNKLSNTKTKIEEKSMGIDKAKSQSQQAVSQSEAIRSDLTALDLSVPNNTYNVTPFDSVKNELDDRIDEVESLVSSSDINSSQKSEINEKLDQLSSKINGNSSGSLGEISSFVASLQTDLESIKTKLIAASGKVSSAESKLAAMTSALNEGIASLDSIKTTLAEIHAELADQQITDPSTIAAPLNIKIEKITAEGTHLNYLFPTLIVLAIMFISLLLGTTLVMMEKHNQAYFRNFIVPVKKITFVLSTYLTNIFLVLIQIVIILGFSLIFLEGILSQIPLIILILLISSSVFTLVGMAVGYAFTSEDTGILASISFGALFLFVSGTILPLESMPAAVRQITYFNPFVLGEKLIREIFIFKSAFLSIYTDLLILISYAVVLFIVILIIDHVASKHFLTKALYKHHKHIKEKKAKKIKVNHLSQH